MPTTRSIKCVNRVLADWSGEIVLFGSPTRSLSQRKLATLVGYVPQPDGRSLPFTVEEFTMMGRYPYLSPFTFVSREDREMVRETLRQTGIERLAERHMNSLSGGERQTAFISAALVQGARLLLLDEPTAFLDYKHQVECSVLLKRMNREFGVTVISVTHDINHAITQSDRVLALRDGRLRFDGDPHVLVLGDTLQAVYETPFATYVSECSDSPMLAPCGGDR
jgi:iron complex transport system ATP-binding protein